MTSTAHVISTRGRRRSALYQTLSTNFGGGNYDPTNWSGRLLRLSMLLVFLVVEATYTANLAAFFISSESELDGPSTLGEPAAALAITPSLRDRLVCPSRDKSRFGAAVADDSIRSDRACVVAAQASWRAPKRAPPRGSLASRDSSRAPSSSHRPRCAPRVTDACGLVCHQADCACDRREPSAPSRGR